MQNYIFRFASNFIHKSVTVNLIPTAGLKYFPPPISYDDVEFPERSRLTFMPKVPPLPPHVRAPKMMKNIKFMRGPEEVHNFLVHKQYGIIALHGGRLKWGHFEVIRMGILRKMKEDRMFAVWRVDSPWQPITKKGQGHRMGGGKGSIDHYVTPVKAGRVIVEMGGKCEFKEVKPILDMIADILPFATKVVSQKMMEKMAEDEKWKEENNLNQYTFKYMVQNNLGGCHQWISPYDKIWFGKYR